MSEPRLSRLEFQIMEALGKRRLLDPRNSESFPEKRSPPTRPSRLPCTEWKRRGRAAREEVSNFHIFAATSRAIRPSEGLSTICWPSSEAAHSLSCAPDRVGQADS